MSPDGATYFPVVSHLTEPLEIKVVVDLGFHHFGQHVPGVYVQHNQSL